MHLQTNADVHFSRNFYTATRNANSTWLAFPHCSWTLPHSDWSLLLSGVDCPSASPFANCLLWVPSSNWPFRFSRTCLSYPTSALVRDLESRPLVSPQNKQKDRLLGAPASWCHKMTIAFRYTFINLLIEVSNYIICLSIHFSTIREIVLN